MCFPDCARSWFIKSWIAASAPATSPASRAVSAAVSLASSAVATPSLLIAPDARSAATRSRTTAYAERHTTASVRLVRREKKSNGLRGRTRSEEHTSELQSQSNLVCRLLLEKKKQNREEEHQQAGERK